jgi:hypothetical protein
MKFSLDFSEFPRIYCEILKFNQFFGFKSILKKRKTGA